MRPVPSIDVLVTPAIDATWPKDGLGSVSVLLAALPEPASLQAGACVGVTGGPPGGRFRHLFRPAPSAHLAVRCAALLAKGYVDVGAGVDDAGHEIAIGRAP